MRVPECSSQRQGWLPAPLNVNPFTVEPDLDTVEVWGSSPGPPPHSFRKFLAPVGRKLGSSMWSTARMNYSGITTHCLPLAATSSRFSPSRETISTLPVRSASIRGRADRSPTHMYRTAPLAGLWSHQKGGFYHDGRFATLPDVTEHYDGFFKLRLTDQEKRDLSEYLKSL
jgi:hypothetical protein